LLSSQCSSQAKVHRLKSEKKALVREVKLLKKRSENWAVSAVEAKNDLVWWRSQERTFVKEGDRTMQDILTLKNMLALCAPCNVTPAPASQRRHETGDDKSVGEDMGLHPLHRLEMSDARIEEVRSAIVRFFKQQERHANAKACRRQKPSPAEPSDGKSTLEESGLSGGAEGTPSEQEQANISGLSRALNEKRAKSAMAQAVIDSERRPEFDSLHDIRSSLKRFLLCDASLRLSVNFLRAAQHSLEQQQNEQNNKGLNKKKRKGKKKKKSKRGQPRRSLIRRVIDPLNLFSSRSDGNLDMNSVESKSNRNHLA
jgi:hypothetical protein